MKRVVPAHYGTFPLLTGTPESCGTSLPAGSICRAGGGRAGGAVSGRERWFGATAVGYPRSRWTGSIDLEGAIVLDDVGEMLRCGDAHARGTPVVVRASTAAAVKEALARPEVSCVLVEDETCSSSTSQA